LAIRAGAPRRLGGTGLAAPDGQRDDVANLSALVDHTVLCREDEGSTESHVQMLNTMSEDTR
jgi:hypothetical protein